MNINPISINQNNKSTNFRANIPYTPKIEAAFNHAENLLENTNHKYSKTNLYDILYCPSPKLQVHDFCENITYLLDKYKPNKTLELGFIFTEMTIGAGKFLTPWKYNWRTDVSIKDKTEDDERVSTHWFCKAGDNLEEVRARACFNALDMFGYSKRCPEPDFNNLTHEKFIKMEEEELVERNKLEKELTIDSVKEKFANLKNRLMQNRVEIEESIPEHPKSAEELEEYFWDNI